MVAMRRLALFLLVSAHPLAAQFTPSAARCDSAITFVTDAPLPSTSSREWNNWETVALCGLSGARAAASVLGQANVRQEQDAARVWQFFRFLAGIQSSDLLGAYQAASIDAAASLPIRLGSLDNMTMFVSPRVTIDSSDPTRFLSGPCPLGGRSSGLLPGVSDLPSTTYQSVLATIRSVAQDASAPTLLHNVADCWRRILERNASVNVTTIRLTYMRGTKFRIRNPNVAPIDVQYDVYGTTESGVLAVLGGEDYFFWTENTGTVRLFYQGVLIQTKANGNTTCP
jgi:hypothetical protein